MWILTNLNIAMNKVKKPALFTLFIGFINILLALISIKVFDMDYTCIPIISSLLQLVWAGIFLPIYSSKEMKVSYNTFYPPLFKALIASVICFLLTVFIKSFFIISNWYTFISIGVLIGLISLVIFALIELGPNKLKYYYTELKSKLQKKNN